MLTTIDLYGAWFSYDEARFILEATGRLGFLRERERQFQSLREDHSEVDPIDMQLHYEDLQQGIPIHYGHKCFETLPDFFDYFGCGSYQIPPPDIDIIPTVFSKKRGIQYHRQRYYADLFCEDADTRGDSLRLMPGRKSVYGIYIASNGYAYHDDVRLFEKDPRIESNFRKHCAPVLESLGLARTPERITLYQTW